MNLTEEQIGNWSKAPSETEDARCINAVSQSINALRAHFGNSLAFVRQGSHTNRTNIRIDSDVDMAVVHTGYHFSDTALTIPSSGTNVQVLSGLYSFIAPAIPEVFSPRLR